jgi:hypothetical protein
MLLYWSEISLCNDKIRTRSSGKKFSAYFPSNVSICMVKVVKGKGKVVPMLK